MVTQRGHDEVLGLLTGFERPQSRAILCSVSDWIPIRVS